MTDSRFADDSHAAYLARLWCETLRRDHVSADDSFFTLGGDSMAVVRMLARVSTHFGRELDIERFFAKPTLAVLERLVVEALPSSASPADGAARSHPFPTETTR